MIYTAIYLTLINITAFAVYGIDKRRAKRKAWRIPEVTLLFLAAIGGALGALLGMFAFHHKTKKWKFRILVPLLLVIWVVILLFFASLFLRPKTGWTLTQYPDASGNQGMFYTLKNNETGTLILIDGGWDENTATVRKWIKRNGGVVDAWFITHYHNDHVDAFNNIYEDPEGIEIRQVYATPLDRDKFYEVAKEWDFPESFDRFLDVTEGAENLTHLQRGDAFEIDGLRVQIFNAYDDAVVTYGSGDIPNNDSLVFKISGMKDDILFCGDAHAKKLGKYLIKTYGDALKAEYVQPGHHGNNSFPTEFYEFVAPRVMLFDAPGWLMTGENYTTAYLKAFCDDMGIETFDYRTGINRFSFS